MKDCSQGGGARDDSEEGDRKLTRGERERLVHRREIAEAAERVFAQRGFERATMEEIAREAEFSVGALYTFFENKEALWLEVATKIGEDLLAAFRKEIQAAGEPMEAITALIGLRLRHIQEHGTFIRVFMEATAGGPAPLLRRRRRFYDEYIDDAAALIQRAMDRGLLRKADATHTILTLEGIMHAFRAYWVRRNMDVPLDEQARLIRQHFLTLTAIPKKGEEEE